MASNSSGSIPIPSRPVSARAPANTSLDVDSMIPLGSSLPSNAHRSFLGSHAHRPVPVSQDDLATISWPPRPSVELVSRAAKKWVSGQRNNRPRRRGSLSEDRVMRFEPWDFSEVALATDEVRTAFQRGSARAERPPREGVCGTYFIRGGEGDVLCVFKPVDEEATDIDMSPPAMSIPFPHSSSFGDSNGSDFSLGPAHVGLYSSPARSPLNMNHYLHRTMSLSSDSDNDFRENESQSRTGRSSGFHAGEGAYKEAAAYLLDHDRFCRVPQTALATCQFSSDLPEKNQSGKHIRAHSIMTNFGEEEVFEDDVIEKSTVETSFAPRSRMRTKMGALQVFVKNEGDADDFGPGVFDKEQVHRIAILDIRTLNHDRHGGNILVAKSSSPNRRYNLIPIDHGYILPEFVQSMPWPVWMDWPMIRKPISDRVKNYIAHLDADAEAHILHKELDGKLSPGSLQGLKIGTMLLQKGVAAGLTLYDIGLLMYSRRDQPNHVSELYKIMMEAEDANCARERNFSDTELDMNPTPLSSDDHYHRRHQSMSALSSLFVPEAFSDDYIVKYAGRRIQEVVALAAAKKMNEEEASNSPGSHKLPRSRSIPDFGIGIKPLHALLQFPGEDGVPAPTPVSSPVTTSRARSANETLEAQVFGRSQTVPRTAPSFQVPIDDRNVRRIALPEPRLAKMADTSRFHGRSTSVPANIERNPNPLVMDSLPTAALPPFFKVADRKSSPVAPQELVAWETGSS